MSWHDLRPLCMSKTSSINAFQCRAGWIPWTCFKLPPPCLETSSARICPHPTLSSMCTHTCEPRPQHRFSCRVASCLGEPTARHASFLLNAREMAPHLGIPSSQHLPQSPQSLRRVTVLSWKTAVPSNSPEHTGPAPPNEASTMPRCQIPSGCLPSLAGSKTIILNVVKMDTSRQTSLTCFAMTQYNAKPKSWDLGQKPANLQYCQRMPRQCRRDRAVSFATHMACGSRGSVGVDRRNPYSLSTITGRSVFLHLSTALARGWKGHVLSGMSFRGWQAQNARPKLCSHLYSFGARLERLCSKLLSGIAGMQYC